MLQIPCSTTDEAPNTTDLPPSYSIVLQNIYADQRPPNYTDLPQSMQQNVQPLACSAPPALSSTQATGMVGGSAVLSPVLQHDFSKK